MSSLAVSVRFVFLPSYVYASEEEDKGEEGRVFFLVVKRSIRIKAAAKPRNLNLLLCADFISVQACVHTVVLLGCLPVINTATEIAATATRVSPRHVPARLRHRPQELTP